MLSVSQLETSYGLNQVLFGIDFAVDQGEVVTLLGRNGMGKTTTINSIIGLVPSSAGEITFKDTPIRTMKSFRIARLGIGLVPEGRQVFPNLSVHENLIATAANRRSSSSPWTEDRIYAMFPHLQARRGAMANLLSGGEQQMLAIGRALMTNPTFLILDEATEGLAPLVRQEIWACLRALKDEGLSILVVDKNVADLVSFADRHVIIEKGKVVWTGSSDALAGDHDLQHRYLGVGD